MAAVGALQAREAGREIAAAVELVDDGYRVVAQRAVGLAVGALVASAEVAPGVVDDLTSSIRIGFAFRFRAPLIAAWHCQRGEARGRRG